MPNSIEEGIPICDRCGRAMVVGSSHGESIKYACPNDCEFIKYGQGNEAILSDEEIEFYANMEPDDSKKPYINHCWNCKAPIDSRECKEDPGHGYICDDCGKSLREYPGMR